LVRPSLLLLLLLPAPGDRNHTHEVFYSSFRENPLALLIRFGFRLSLSPSFSQSPFLRAYTVVPIYPLQSVCLSAGIKSVCTGPSLPLNVRQIQPSSCFGFGFGF
jgi:hypothetical protein